MCRLQACRFIKERSPIQAHLWKEARGTFLQRLQGDYMSYIISVNAICVLNFLVFPLHNVIGFPRR